MGQNNDVVLLGSDETVEAACSFFATIKSDFTPEFSVLDVSRTHGRRVFCSSVAAVSFSFLPLDELAQVRGKYPDLTVLVMQDGDDAFVEIETLEKER